MTTVGKMLYELTAITNEQSAVTHILVYNCCWITFWFVMTKDVSLSLFCQGAENETGYYARHNWQQVSTTG